MKDAKSERPATTGGGGFVARMREKQKKEEADAKRAADERAKIEAHKTRKTTDMSNFFALTKIKKQANVLAKKQTIKRTSEYEKGHPWVCNMCNQRNRALMMACKTCGRPQRFFIKRCRPAHGLR